MKTYKTIEKGYYRFYGRPERTNVDYITEETAIYDVNESEAPIVAEINKKSSYKRDDMTVVIREFHGEQYRPMQKHHALRNQLDLMRTKSAPTAIASQTLLEMCYDGLLPLHLYKALTGNDYDFEKFKAAVERNHYGKYSMHINYSPSDLYSDNIVNSRVICLDGKLWIKSNIFMLQSNVLRLADEIFLKNLYLSHEIGYIGIKPNFIVTPLMNTENKSSSISIKSRDTDAYNIDNAFIMNFKMWLDYISTRDFRKQDSSHNKTMTSQLINLQNDDFLEQYSTLKSKLDNKDVKDRSIIFELAQNVCKYLKAPEWHKEQEEKQSFYEHLEKVREIFYAHDLGRYLGNDYVGI